MTVESQQIKLQQGTFWINPTRKEFERFTESIDINRDEAEKHRHLRLHIKIQKSTHAHYGILGATLYPTETDSIEFLEPYRDAYWEDYPASLIQSIHDSLSYFSVNGKLVFDYRYYSNTDSSPFIFTVMGHCLVHFFATPSNTLSGKLVQTVFESTYERLAKANN